jgi:hypothetical protein
MGSRVPNSTAPREGVALPLIITPAFLSFDTEVRYQVSCHSACT